MTIKTWERRELIKNWGAYGENNDFTLASETGGGDPPRAHKRSMAYNFGEAQMKFLKIPYGKIKEL